MYTYTYRLKEFIQNEDIPIVNSKTTMTVMMAQMTWVPKIKYGASRRTNKRTKVSARAIFKACIDFERSCLKLLAKEEKHAVKA